MEIIHSYRVQTPKWEGEIRRCSSCGVNDHPLYAGYANEEGAPIFDHDVVVDLVYLHKRNVLTREETSKGWAFIVVEDRPAKARMICRNCLQLEADTESVWSDWKKQRDREAEDGNDPSWWYQICMEA